MTGNPHDNPFFDPSVENAKRSIRKRLVVDMRRNLGRLDTAREDCPDFVDEGRQPLRIVGFLALLVPGLDTAKRQQEMGRPLGHLQPVGECIRPLTALLRVEDGALDQTIVLVKRPVGILRRDFLPAGKIHQIKRARRHDLRRAQPACILQPVRPAADQRPCQEIAEFLQAEIHDAAEGPLPCQAFEGHAAHAGGMEDSDFVPPVFECRFQKLHIGQATGAKRCHADQRL